ncbi:hypothetical protein ACFQ60_00760 [Streptomyces zhihengii]|uniref:Uncharacterized protein n=1 Tax=Streptomyces zhihengii TaxID=1818004 RepID=A0ABS2V4T6_9ACTN|nr:hypothetical protein [Streptomyces zhihengii]MBM9624363.1 hypothetical protein [Streptomyces zhihengii]
MSRYQVIGAHGEAVGTLTREKALRGKGLRTRWTVHPAGAPEAVDYKGRIVWWWLWSPLLPFMALVLLATVPGNEGGLARAPRRIRWRAEGQVPLEFRSRGNKLLLHAPGVDWRLGAALIALLRSFQPTRGTRHRSDSRAVPDRGAAPVVRDSTRCGAAAGQRPWRAMRSSIVARTLRARRSCSGTSGNSTRK